jgi:hypothetical protein
MNKSNCLKHGIAIDFFLRATQSVFAFLYINLQSLGVTTSIFSTLLLITSIQALVIFIDFGESTKIVQEHLGDSASGQKSPYEELFLILKSMKVRSKRVSLIATLNSLAVSLFGIVASSRFDIKYDLSDGSAVFISVYIFFIAWYLGRALVAVGMIRILLTLQLIAVSIQAGSQYLLYLSDAPSTLYFLNTGSAGLVFILLFLMISWKKAIHNKSTSNSDVNLAKVINRSYESWKVQFLQIVQVSYLVILPILLAWNLSPQNFSSFSFQLKVSYAITAALGAGLVTNWRSSFLESKPSELEKSAYEVKPVYQIVSVGVLVTITICLLLNFVWDDLFNPQYRPSLISWILWPFVVSSQLAIWHYFYLLIAKKMYYSLIGGTLLQLTSQMLISWIWNFDNPILAPLLLLIPQSVCATVYLIKWSGVKPKKTKKIESFMGETN